MTLAVKLKEKSYTEHHQEGASSTDSVTESPEEIQERRRGFPSQPSKLVSSVKQFRQLSYDVVNNEKVQSGIIFLILINSIMMGVATFDFVEENVRLAHGFNIADKVFLIIFTVELLMQVVGRGVLGVLSDGWLCFDTAVIIASWSLEQLQVARAFRIFRTLRLATRLDALKSLVQALMRVAPSVGAICSLLLLVMYIYGVMCTVLYHDLYENNLTDDSYFDRLDNTLFTLFQFITMENWSEVVRQVTTTYYSAWPLFITYITISGFLLYSLIIAVICDAVAMENSNEDDMTDSAAMKILQGYSIQIERLRLNQHEILENCRLCTSHLKEKKRASLLNDQLAAANRSSILSFFFGNKRENREGRPKVHFLDAKDGASVAEDPACGSSSFDSIQSVNVVWKWIRSFRNLCGAIVNDARVQTVVVILILINAIMMGVATFDVVADSPSAVEVFEKTDLVFLIIFTVELGLQLIYRGPSGLLNDGWLCFDAIVICSSWALEKVQIVRALRVFRAARLINRLETLKILVQALIDVAPSVGGIVALLGLILYIYAVMCTVFFEDLYEKRVTDEDYFGSLPRSFFTLFQCVTLSFSDVTRQVAVEYPWAKAFFVVFVILTSFILFSLVVAVVCDAVMSGERAESIGEKELLARISQLENEVSGLVERQNRIRQIADEMLTKCGISPYPLALSRNPSGVSACSSGGSFHQEEWLGNFVCPNLSESIDDEESVATTQTSLSLTIKTRRPKRPKRSGPNMYLR